MRRSIAIISIMTVGLAFSTGTALAQKAMKPSAAEKMMPPGEKRKLEDCQKLAAQRNIKMDERAKFLMDCMTGKVK